MMRGLCMILIAAAVWSTGTRAEAHCEIPCGIYGDGLRFSMIEEDIDTIEKSMKKIVELSADPAAEANQLTRWVLNKEHHADHVREIVTQYFLTQRIKLPAEGDAAATTRYTEHLTMLHKMLVYSMKAKQTTDTMWVEKLRDTLGAFHESYSH